MDFLTLMAIYAAFFIISALLLPKPKVKQDPGDFRPPEPREGEPIAVVFGTVLNSPAVTWFGDVGWKKVKKTVSTMLGLIQEDIPLGYDYYAGIMFVICHGPIDAMLDIFIGEKRVVRTAKYVGEGLATEPAISWPAPSTPTLPEAYPESGDPTRVSINLPDLFGGKEEGGGIVGQFDLHWGSHTQGPNDYLGVWWGTDIVPNYRDICYVVLRRMNVGKSPSMQPWKFVVRRIPDVLGQTAYATITDEDGNLIANGAECIYEILTDKVWGLGKKAGEVDLDSFQQAAQTLYGEGLGYSGQILAKGEAWQHIQTILRHIEGVVYQDPLSGLISLKLIRNDYTVGNLVELDESNSVIEEYTRGSWAEAANETQVKFTDIARRFSDAAAQAQNLAAIQAMDGEIISNDYDMKGLSTHEQAQLAAERLNRTTSVPLIRGRSKTNRIAYAFHPGKPFKITYPEYGISAMVCRVVSVNYGALVTGEIEVNWVQDVWDLNDNAYASPDDLNDLEPCGPLALLVSGYDPSADPGAEYGPGYGVLFEAPYWFNTTGGRAWMAQGRATNADAYWECWRSVHGALREKMTDVQDFVPVGLLDESMEQTGTDFTSLEFTVTDAGDLDTLTSTDFAGMLAGDRFLMIDDEIFAWERIENLGDGQYRISGAWRAVLDTVPAYHVQSSRVYFFYNASGGNSAFDLTDPDDLDDFTGVQVWPVIVKLDGTADNPDRVEMLEVMVGQRASAPYPPGDVKVNGDGYDNWPTSTTGDVTLSWAHRGRSQSQMVAQDDGVSYTLEGTLTIEVLLDGVSVREWTSITGTSQQYTYAQRVSDDADTTKRVEFRITPIGSSSEEGVVRTTPPFLMQSS